MIRFRAPSFIHTRRWGAVPVGVAAVLAVAACGGADTSAPDAGAGVSSTPGARGGAVQPSASAPAGAGATPIHVIIDGHVLNGRLWNNAAGRDLASRLPVRLTFRDLSNQEKIGHLQKPLSMEGLPAGDDPAPGDIGWYEPWGNVVFYYGDVGYWEGIARIGTFDSGIDIVAAQNHDFSATIEPAD